MTTEITIQNQADDCNASDIQSKRRLPAPQKIRRGEVREGGYIVIERTNKLRLLRPSLWPIEMADLASAVVAAKRLREKYPEREFCIFEQVGSFTPGGKK